MNTDETELTRQDRKDYEDNNVPDDSAARETSIYGSLAASHLQKRLSRAVLSRIGLILVDTDARLRMALRCLYVLAD
jgi:hypothetical protein